MLMLAFETSAKSASAALADESGLLAECFQNTGVTHSQTLLIMAEELLKQCGRKPSDVTDVAVANGPGSFTGIRIGGAAAKGFSWGRQLPCWGVSTLEAMVLGFDAWGGTVCAVMDARRDQVYNAIFRAEAGVYTRLCEDRAISLEQLGEELLLLDGPIFLVGDGSRLCFRSLSNRIQSLVMPSEHRMHQRASGVILAAAAMKRRGESCDAAEMVPNYLRLSQAERERTERLARENVKL